MNQIEKKALLVGLFANFSMAICGWMTFYFSGSEAILLDSNFSFILCFTGGLALLMNNIKIVKLNNGNFNSTYIFFKGGLILLILVLALISSIDRIYSYWIGNEIKPLETGIIVYYVVFVIMVCIGLAYFYYYQNKKINFKSHMLKVETTSSTIDGLISSGSGFALILIGFIKPGSPFSFMIYIGDSIVVLILTAFMIKTPIDIIISEYYSLYRKRSKT